MLPTEIAQEAAGAPAWMLPGQPEAPAWMLPETAPAPTRLGAITSTGLTVPNIPTPPGVIRAGEHTRKWVDEVLRVGGLRLEDFGLYPTTLADVAPLAPRLMEPGFNGVPLMPRDQIPTLGELLAVPDVLFKQVRTEVLGTGPTVLAGHPLVPVAGDPTDNPRYADAQRIVWALRGRAKMADDLEASRVSLPVRVWEAIKRPVGAVVAVWQRPMFSETDRGMRDLWQGAGRVVPLAGAAYKSIIDLGDMTFRTFESGVAGVHAGLVEGAVALGADRNQADREIALGLLALSMEAPWMLGPRRFLQAGMKAQGLPPSLATVGPRTWAAYFAEVARREARTKALAAMVMVRMGRPTSPMHEQVLLGYGRSTAETALAEARREQFQFMLNHQEILEPVGSIAATVMNQATQATTINAFLAEMALRGGLQPNAVAFKRVQQNIVSVLKSAVAQLRQERGGTTRALGTTDFLTRNPELNKLLEVANDIGLTPEALFDMFLFTGSEAGRTLRQRSLVQQSLLDALRRDAMTNPTGTAANTLRARYDAQRRALIGHNQEPSWARRMMTLWRSGLLAQLATIMRNVLDTETRITLNVMERGLENGLQRLLNPRDPAGLAPVRPFAELGAQFSLFRDATVKLGLAKDPSKMTQMIERVTAAYPNLTKPIFDFVLGAGEKFEGGAGPATTIARYMSMLNRGQEMVFRRVIFGVELDRLLRQQGMSLELVTKQQMVPRNMPELIVEAGVRARRETWALRPETTSLMARKFWQPYLALMDNPVGMFVDPFPRFMFNLVDYVTGHMPSGGMRFLTPTNRAKIVAGDYRPIAREVLSTALLALAFAIRSGQAPGITPGAQFHQITISEGPNAGMNISLLQLASLAPLLGIADLMIRIDEGRLPNDESALAVFAAYALNYRPQAGLYSDAIAAALEELVQTTSGKDGVAQLKLLAGRIGAGYLTPFKMVQDFWAEWKQELSLQRETSSRGLTSPIVVQLAPELLPERESPTRGATPRAPRVTLPFDLGNISSKVINQLTGIRITEPATVAEHTLDYLGFTAADFAPRTGDRQLDALVRQFMGPYVEATFAVVTDLDVWQQWPIAVKIAVARDLIVAARQAALEDTARVAPTAMDYSRLLRSLPKIDRRAIDALLQTRTEGLTLDSLLMGVKSEIIKRELEALGQ